MTASEMNKASLSEYVEFVMDSAKSKNVLPSNLHYDLCYQYGMIGHTRYMEARNPIYVKEEMCKMQKESYLHRYYSSK